MRSLIPARPSPVRSVAGVRPTPSSETCSRISPPSCVCMLTAIACVVRAESHLSDSPESDDTTSRQPHHQNSHLTPQHRTRSISLGGGGARRHRGSPLLAQGDLADAGGTQTPRIAFTCFCMWLTASRIERPRCRISTSPCFSARSAMLATSTLTANRNGPTSSCRSEPDRRAPPPEWSITACANARCALPTRLVVQP